MDAIRRMVSDHETLDDLLRRLEGATANGRGELATEWTTRLLAHVRAADALVLPMLSKRMKGDEVDRLRQVLAVDTRLSGELKRMAAMPPGDDGFDAQLQRIKRELSKHQDLESSLVLPRTEDLLDDKELNALGERIERMEEALVEAARRRRTGQARFDLVGAARGVGIIGAAGVVLAILGHRPRMRSSGPRPPQR